MNYFKKMITSVAVLAMALSMGATTAMAAQEATPKGNKKAPELAVTAEPTPINITMGRYVQEMLVTADMNTAENLLNLNFSGNANISSGTQFDVTYMCGKKEAGKPTSPQLINYTKGKVSVSFPTLDKPRCAVDSVKLTSTVDNGHLSNLWRIDEASPVIPITSEPTVITAPQDTTPIFPTESIVGSGNANGVFFVNDGSGYLVPGDTTWNVDYSVNEAGNIDYNVTFSDKTLNGFGYLIFSDGQYGSYGDIVFPYYVHNGEAKGTYDPYQSVDGSNLTFSGWQSSFQTNNWEHYAYEIYTVTKNKNK